tara:strand:+ start:842 stop:2065 length:1224 start_codon:yes stop_codon:yes gene_type:complete
MSTFKLKSDKIYKNTKRITLDAEHKKKIEYFKEIKTKNIKLKQDYKKFKIEYEELNAIKPELLTDNQLNRKLLLRHTLKDSKKKIISIEKNTEMNEYYTKTAPILYQYYENINNYKVKDEIKITNLKKNSIINYFNNNSDTKSNDIPNKNKNNKLSHLINSGNSFQKANLLNNYLTVTDKNYINKTTVVKSILICKNCKEEKIILKDEGYVVCNKCGQVTNIYLESNKPSFKNPPPEISYFAYKRINHFNEILAQFQGKESTEIPQEIYDNLINEIKKERIKNMALLNDKKIKEYLKKLKLNKYYEHIPHIINRLCGLPPPVLSPEIEEKLRVMFKEIQIPFREVCPNNRKNFLSYYYVLHKFVELLSIGELKSSFPLLKSREKLHEQDKIWKKICNILKWEFVRSI